MAEIGSEGGVCISVSTWGREALEPPFTAAGRRAAISRKETKVWTNLDSRKEPLINRRRIFGSQYAQQLRCIHFRMGCDVI